MNDESAPDSCTKNSGCSSIEQMLAVNPGKTPISLLQEYGTRIGKTPVYDLLKAEGQAHQPNFTFRVSVGEISCTGQGPSKKAAKHKAAEAALKMLKGGLGGLIGVSVGEEGFISVEEAVEEDSTQIEMKTSSTSQQSECNPVGALQELVVQKGWRLPEYTVTQESGPAHRKEFTMTCRVERFVEIGSKACSILSPIVETVKSEMVGQEELQNICNHAPWGGHTFRWVAEFGVDTELFAYGGCGPVVCSAYEGRAILA
ncbi:unnamed protein product [Boreogadus saida]